MPFYMVLAAIAWILAAPPQVNAGSSVQSAAQNASGAGLIAVAAMECSACGSMVRQCHGVCKGMPRGLAKKACHGRCNSKKAVCKASCGGERIDLDKSIHVEVSGSEARKLTLNTRERLVSALPPDIDDITAILDQQKAADPARAEERRRTADAEPPDGLSKQKVAEFYAKRGLAAGEIGRAEQAVNDLRKAVELAKGVDMKTYKTALWDLAHAEGRVGLLQDAISHREAYMKLPMSKGERMTKSGILSTNYAMAGDLAKGKETLKKAEQLMARMHRAPKHVRDKYGNVWLGRAKRAKGNILMVEGRYGEAEDLFRDALHLAEADIKRGEDEKFSAVVRDYARMRIAEAMIRQGRLVEAEIELRKVLLDTLARTGRYSTDMPSVLNRFSQLLVAQGRFKEAEDLANAAIETMRTMAYPDDSLRLVFSRISLADIRFLMGDTQGALALFDEIEKSIADSKEPLTRQKLEANRDRLMAMALEGDPGKAKSLITGALKGGHRKMKRKRADPYLHGAMAIVLSRSDDRKGAHAEFQRAVPALLEGVRESGDDEDYTQGTASEFRTSLIFEAYITHLAALRGTPLEAELKVDAAEEAFRIADVARGQLVQRAVAAASARSAAKDEKLAELVRTEQDTRKRLTAQSGLLAGILSSPTDQQDPATVKQLQDTVAKLRKGLESLEVEIAKKFPDYASLLTPAPPGVREVQAALREHEALISIFIGKDHTYVWAVPKTGAMRFQTADLGRERVSKMVEALRGSLEPQAATIGDIPDFDVRVAHRLYEQLLAPVKDAWGPAKSLLVSTNGALGQLPLSVLPMERPAPGEASGPVFSDYRGVKWLARDYAVTVLPSAATLGVLRSLPDARAGRKPFVGFGNPFFSKEQADKPAPATVATADLQSRGLIATRGIPIRLRSAPPTRDRAMSDLSILPPLPDTAEEVRSLAVTMKTDPSDSVQLGLKANEETIKSMDLASYRIIAFATHGLVPGDLSGLREPALALTAPELAKGDGDGLLTMSEIMGLKLDADWVILSACNTGTGRGGGAEAVSGLGRAFFYAGTRTLLVSSWPVETTSARLLTTDLFRRVTENSSLDRAIALQQAMAALIDRPAQADPKTGEPLFYYAHPIFWAPFIMVGDGGGASAS